MDMAIPTGLKHKPVVVSEQYNKVDGRYAPSSDAKGLSLGLAQWNDRGRVDISAKVWRHTGEKWSRQSEELPLHRVLDLSILILRAKLYFKERYRLEKSEGGTETKIERLPLQGGALNVALCGTNPLLEEDLKLFDECLHRDDEIIGERLQLLTDLLAQLEV